MYMLLIFLDFFGLNTSAMPAVATVMQASAIVCMKHLSQDYCFLERERDTYSVDFNMKSLPPQICIGEHEFCLLGDATSLQAPACSSPCATCDVVLISVAATQTLAAI